MGIQPDEKVMGKVHIVIGCTTVPPKNGQTMCRSSWTG